MNKNKIIKAIIGEKMKPHGYRCKSDGYIWVFTKKVKNASREPIKLQLILEQDRTMQNRIGMGWMSNANGRERQYKFDDALPDGTYSYSTEEEFTKIIEKFAEIAETVAIDELNNMIEPVDDPRRIPYEDAPAVHSNHDELCKKYIKRKDITSSLMNDYKASIYFLVSETEKLHGKNYKDYREEAMEAASYLGVMTSQHYPTKWEMYDSIVIINYDLVPGFTRMVALIQAIVSCVDRADEDDEVARLVELTGSTSDRRDYIFLEK